MTQRSLIQLWAVLLFSLASSPPAPCVLAASEPAAVGLAGASGAAPADTDGSPVPSGPVEIKAPAMPEQPAGGKGRLTLSIQGNRRWCTFRDDRVAQAPDMKSMRPGAPPPPHDPIFTFGYQFTIAAVERSRPGETLMLFESPIYRTAVLREAIKIGQGSQPAEKTPQVFDPDRTKTHRPGAEMPSSIVPMWQEQYRCAKVPGLIEFDLDPGIYDIYMAFDILLRSGGWAHRSIAYQTDVTLEAGKTTRLEGAVSMSGGARQDFRISGATQESGSDAAAGGR